MLCYATIVMLLVITGLHCIGYIVVVYVVGYFIYLFTSLLTYLRIPTFLLTYLDCNNN